MRASGAAQLARRAPVGSRPLKDTSSWSQTRVSASARQPRERGARPHRAHYGNTYAVAAARRSVRAHKNTAPEPALDLRARPRRPATRGSALHTTSSPHIPPPDLNSRPEIRDETFQTTPPHAGIPHHLRWNSIRNSPFGFPPRCFSSTGFRSRGRGGRRGGGEGWRGGWSGTRAGWSGTSGQSGPR